MPSGPVWLVTNFFPKSLSVAWATSRGVLQTITPPALPLAPECIWALATTSPPNFLEISNISWGVEPISPLGKFILYFFY